VGVGGKVSGEPNQGADFVEWRGQKMANAGKGKAGRWKATAGQDAS
jgi:hypothetical protein